MRDRLCPSGGTALTAIILPDAEVASGRRHGTATLLSQRRVALTSDVYGSIAVTVLLGVQCVQVKLLPAG